MYSRQPRADDVGEQQQQQHCTQKWQEEISTGFDRLVAFAAVVDKRRKSCDSSSSPGFNTTGTTSSNTPVDESDMPINVTSAAANASRPNSGVVAGPGPGVEEKFDSRNAMLSMKFKRSGSYHPHLPTPQQRAYPTTGQLPPTSLAASSVGRLPTRSPMSSSGSKHFAASSIPRDIDLVSSPPPLPSSNMGPGGSGGERSPLPGENLPEFHFKKRFLQDAAAVVKKRPSLLKKSPNGGDDGGCSGNPAQSNAASLNRRGMFIKDAMDPNVVGERSSLNPTSSNNPSAPAGGNDGSQHDSLGAL